MAQKFVSFLFFLTMNAIDSGSAIVTIDKEAAKMECDADTPMVVPNFKANWFKATEYCHYLGRHLVIVTSPEKQQVISKVLEGTDKIGDSSFWIGGSDLAELGNFHWHSTGTRIVWHNWSELLVVPSADDVRKDDRCVLLRDGMEQGGFKWTVVNCWDEYYFVCEKGVYA
ncbi:perlucin-like [Toxorhynchites rutilus septentrionalis]|uniref:perlucin-like n=1 Tax=Toxorhynchites rutilus septentrionalis TaxID=329112 RepID=UPI00247A3AC6|nr:perlucin-like [Toxorhynchites rutilus septentrionalis]XP_055639215.1 perlucin-like [Toxorhynchites rutilus septentrionalis]